MNSDLPTSTKGNAKWVPWAVAIVCTGLAALLLTFAWNMWPLPNGDGICFMPNMLNYAKEGRLVNDVMPLYRQFSPAGDGRLVWHGFLYQMIVGELAPPSYRWIFFTMGAIDALALALWSAFLYRIMVRLTSPIRWWHVVFVLLSIAGMATTLVGFFGRPTPFTIFVLGLSVNLLLSLPRRWHAVVGGLAVGIAATADPVGAFFGGLSWSIYTSCRSATKEWIREILVSALFAIFAMTAVLTWYPYSFLEWVRGALPHAELSIVEVWHADPFYYWFVVSRPPLFGLICLLALVSAALLYRRYGHQIRCRIGFWLSAILFLAGIYYFTMRVASRNYNLVPVVPLAYGLIYAAVAGWVPRWPENRSGYLAIAGVFIASLVLAVSALGFARAFVVFTHYLRHGTSYEVAKARVEQLRQEYQERITLSGSFFILAEHCWDLTFYKIKGSAPADIGDVLMLQQGYKSTQVPPKIPDFQLMEDHFLRTVPKVMGIKCGNSPLGYEYAVFFRTNGMREFHE